MHIGKKISNLLVIIVFLAVAIIMFLIVILRITTFHIVGHSMNPTLYEDELVLSIPKKAYERGDIIAFDMDGTIAIKRVIGVPGDKIFIADDGTVSVNGTPLNEPYIQSKAKGQVEVVNPYQVIKGEYFVLGDNRADSKDSRLLKVGGIKEDRIRGKIVASISKFKILK